MRMFSTVLKYLNRIFVHTPAIISQLNKHSPRGPRLRSVPAKKRKLLVWRHVVRPHLSGPNWLGVIMGCFSLFADLADSASAIQFLSYRDHFPPSH